MCELVRAGLLEVVDTAFGGVRQWALLRAAANSSAAFAELARAGPAPAPVLPCARGGAARRCKIRWTRHLAQRTWKGDDGSPFGRRERAAQERMTRECRAE